MNIAYQGLSGGTERLKASCSAGLMGQPQQIQHKPCKVAKKVMATPLALPSSTAQGLLWQPPEQAQVFSSFFLTHNYI